MTIITGTEVTTTTETTINAQLKKAIQEITQAAEQGRSCTYVLDNSPMFLEVAQLLAKMGYFVKIKVDISSPFSSVCNFVAWHPAFPLGTVDHNF